MFRAHTTKSCFLTITSQGQRRDAGWSSVGLITDQLARLDEERVNLGRPKKAKLLNMKQRGAAISQIETRTGLTFPRQVKAADTIGSVAPVVGAEAAIPLTSLEDLLR